jgi:hypothetical protein
LIGGKARGITDEIGGGENKRKNLAVVREANGGVDGYDLSVRQILLSKVQLL